MDLVDDRNWLTPEKKKFEIFYERISPIGNIKMMNVKAVFRR